MPRMEGELNAGKGEREASCGVSGLVLQRIAGETNCGVGDDGIRLTFEPVTPRQVIRGQASLLKAPHYCQKRPAPFEASRFLFLLHLLRFAIRLDNRREILATVAAQAHRLIQLLRHGTEDHRLMGYPCCFSRQSQILEHQLCAKAPRVTT